jgi:hypothetical protein
MNTPWYKRLSVQLAIAVALGVLVGAAGGWQLKPDVVKVEERQVIDEKATEREVAKRVAELEKTMSQKIVRVYVTKPDGTKTVTEKIDTEKKSTLKEALERVAVKDVERKVDTERKVTPVLAQWSIGAGVGVLPRFDAPPETAILGHVSVARRVAGPVWGEVWVQGGSPIAAPKPAGFAGGVGVRVEF